MRTKHIFGLLVVGLSLAAAGSGCGGGGSNGTGGEGGAGGDPTTSGSVVSSSSSGGQVKDTNTSCATAEELSLQSMDPTAASLEDVTEDRDYFTFTGKKGDAIAIFTDAKPDTNEFDTTYADLVLTLFGPDGTTQIAQNDDPYPLPPATNDSEIVLVLPEDGTYCVEVAECAALFGVNNCRASGASDPEFNDYTIQAFQLNPAGMGVGAEKEPNENLDVATPISMNKNVMSGAYVSFYDWGTFSSATDVDMWSFKPPADVKVTSGRATCNFEFWLGGAEGNGSTAEQGVIGYIATMADPATHIAEVDTTKIDTTIRPEPPSIALPCTLDTQYLFVMTRPQGATAGANDFYLFRHYYTGSNPVEMGPNDNIAMPEALEQVKQPDGSASFFIDGDIEKAGDIDYYTVPVPAGLTRASFTCAAQRGGSGVRGLKVSVLGTNDMPLSGGMGTSTESETKSLRLEGMPIPQGTTNLKFKVESASLAADVSSTFYRCGFHLDPPAAP